MRVFWDTNLFIYLIERHPVFGRKVRELISAHAARGEQVVRRR